MARRSAKTRSLRDACIDEALAIIEKQGVEALSLREVARRLGVSHQAPYKHFPSRDHILAELVARAFAAFAAHLDARPPNDDPRADLAALGRAYLDYASHHPLQYRLMFGTPLPNPGAHPDMMRNARHAFAVLQAVLGRRPSVPGKGASYDEVNLDALFVWSAVHGIASMMQTNAISTLGLSREVLAASPLHSMSRIRAALEGEPAAMRKPRRGRSP
ncbi:TetR/AcrR family transcriptional regulator [Reyranella sp.]|uniref:TetR/AcrR family transcriptional regulator n=1 Tax=Reyranella sp. TaxID=1929291 RepID=UPI003D108359